jgi:hypothetical protein
MKAGVDGIAAKCVGNFIFLVYTLQWLAERGGSLGLTKNECFDSEESS